MNYSSNTAFPQNSNRIGSTLPTKRILAIGAVMVDTVCHIPHLPQPGEGVVVQKQSSHLGGCAFNSAWTARLLGANCTLFAPIGEGLYASFITENLTAYGFSSPFQTNEQDNGNCTCLVDPTGERTMVTTPGVERNFKTEWFNSINPQEYSIAFVSGYEIEGSGGNAIISFLEQNPHLEVYYAPGPRIQGVGPEKTTRINALSPIWHLNDLEALSYSGCNTLCDAAYHLRNSTDNTVVITTGAKGALCLDDTGLREIPTMPVTPLDTVGAGDAHLGAIVAARSQGLNWEDSITLANDVAALACLTEGAIIPSQAFSNSNLFENLQEKLPIHQ